MKKVLYVMQFTGKAAPVDGAKNILKASTTSPGCTIATVVRADGVSGTLERTGGGTAAFESEVVFSAEGVFQESGSITFGDGGHRLYFSTVGQGYMGPSAEPGLQHGVVSWKIERGEGQFAGASGLITSNFFVSATGEVTDHHFGVIFVT
jgi:hypothetical protein